MFGSLGATEIAVILLIAIILFGAKRLPTLGKSLGEGIQSFRGAMRELHSSDDERPRTNDAANDDARHAAARAAASTGRSRRSTAQASAPRKRDAGRRIERANTTATNAAVREAADGDPCRALYLAWYPARHDYATAGRAGDRAYRRRQRDVRRRARPPVRHHRRPASDRDPAARCRCAWHSSAGQPLRRPALVVRGARGQKNRGCSVEVPTTEGTPMDNITHESPHIPGEMHLGTSASTCFTCRRRRRGIDRLVKLTAARLKLADQELLEAQQ